MTNTPVLRGLRVVEISAFVAAPLAGTALAEMGADVVRVDPPGGGIDRKRWPLHAGHSLYWIGLNQGKRSAVIDTRSARGRAILVDLIVAAGACITNLPAVEWLSYEILRGRRPDLVMVMISGNPDGSAAVDYTVNAALGFPMVTGPQGWAGPVNHVLPAWDVITAQAATTAMVAAELERARSGRGSLARISLADVALWTAAHLGLTAEAQLEDAPRGRFGNHVFGTYGRDFRTADGRHLMVIALTPRHWRGLVEATGIGPQMKALEAAHGVDLNDEGRRWEYRETISAAIEPWVRERSLSEVQRSFDHHGVLWSPYRSFKELLAEDARASTANPLFARISQPGVGSVLAPASPIYFHPAERVPHAAAPGLGDHTHDVLASWLGLGSAELAELATAGVIGGRIG